MLCQTGAADKTGLSTWKCVRPPHNKDQSKLLLGQSKSENCIVVNHLADGSTLETNDVP